MRWWLAGSLLACLGVSGAAGQFRAEPGPSAFEPSSTGGVIAVDRALARLSTHRRLLVVGAHPDDEDTSLLALVARQMGGEAAYLSLSRGEGGQNLIGPELGVALGLLRTGELLAARGVDGARQFFTRAYDFGYTRTLDEALRYWPREVLLEDAVRVFRRFRPQVVVSVFPADPRAGHGQHQAAGLVADEAFRLAGNPEALPQLRREGWLPWSPQALYRASWWDPESTSLELLVGRLDPLSGKSIFQLAMASRSMHRSQDMGMLQELGPRTTPVAWVAGGVGPEAEDLFAGIDTRLAAIAATLPEGEPRRALAGRLAEVESLARQGREVLSPGDPYPAVPHLVAIVAGLRRALEIVSGADAAATTARELVREKLTIAEWATAAAAGIALDATAARERVWAGSTVAVTARVWNAGTRRVRVEDLHLVGADGRQRSRVAGADLSPGGMGEWELDLEVPAGAAPTLPYFLRRPLDGALYRWDHAPAELWGAPTEPADASVGFELEVDGTRLVLEREIVHRRRDQAVGEVRRPLRVVPRVEVAVEPGLLLWPRHDRRPRRLEVVVTSNIEAATGGRVLLRLPPGWPEVAARPFAIPGLEGNAVVEIAIQPPEDLPAGRFALELAAELDDGDRVELALPVIDYPHIRPLAMPRPAEVLVSAFDLVLPELSRVGYIRGASDRVPEFLQAVGLPIELLTREELLHGDLLAYDALVVGSRAYETDAVLAQANPRLLAYVRAGGLMIVQYQQYQFIEGGFAPLALEFARPHDRVTDETSPVRVLRPEHPVLSRPNPIGEEDWRGWVQERGLYFARVWDPGYTPLVAMADPGAPELHGGLLVAAVGRGHYVYTGLALFRQLPAGVAGAYRLFANLLALAGEPASAGSA